MQIAENIKQNFAIKQVHKQHPCYELEKLLNRNYFVSAEFEIDTKVQIQNTDASCLKVFLQFYCPAVREI